MAALTHIDERGRARMVDVSAKDVTERTATAYARIKVGKKLRALIASDRVAKGDVLAVARIAGIMAAKKTSDLLPLCHPLALDAVDVVVTLEPKAVVIRATVKVAGRTGVEMEALTAVSVAALAVYDMCKALDRGLVIEEVRLEAKRGGKSGTYER